MGALNAVEFVSLDGVMQGFHGPDERDRFRHSGWGAAYADQTQVDAAVEEMPSAAAYLLGRRTYDELAQFWPHQPDSNAMAAHLNRTPKFVATRTRGELSWRNAEHLEGELTSAVAALKARTDGSIVVLGSGEVLAQLFAAGLVDGLRLFVHPLVLGSGHRLFPDLAEPWRLRLESTTQTPTGVLMLTYAADR
jgi:dihydrofolate reductase